jgi:hypothetical protein
VSLTRGTMKLAFFSLKQKRVSADVCIPRGIHWNILGVCSEGLVHLTDFCMCVYK